MSQSLRQSELFAGEDWKVIYRAFSEINFNAYDFDTLRTSMVDYIRYYFPEDFNDWSENSEFVALIDLVAYLGQNLAFRMDLNTHENFIDTAERRSSILRLAQLLSYVPSRNVPARGLVKVVQVKTTEQIIDSLGQGLQNFAIEWNDANNPDWFEQWVLVLNSAFIGTNPFGQPVKTGNVVGFSNQLYQINSVPGNVGQYRYSATVNNQTLPFEIVNIGLQNIGSYYSYLENSPDPLSSFHMIYKNDGNGNSSPDTGFFLYFKQGTTSFKDFNISVPAENRVLDVNINNINQFDVWVQTIDESGFILKNWTQVPSIYGNNIIFNSLTENQRDIYSVIARDNDQISIRFADGVFGNVPTGITRIYYRTSANSSYTILPRDMERIAVSIPYYNTRGEQHTLTLTFDLQEVVANSIPNESTDQIRQRAPQVYYTQNRMVNGEDYNVFPLQNIAISKLKSINRVYSGHSRFIDINDPTSTFQDVNVFADDGAVYEEFDEAYVEIPLSANKTSGEIVSTVLFSLIKDVELQQYFYRAYPEQSNALYGSAALAPNPGSIYWNQATNASFSSTGYFNTSVGLSMTNAPADFIVAGALILFKNAGWVKVESVISYGNGLLINGQGQVTLSESVLTGDFVVKVMPGFRTTLLQTEVNNIKVEIDNKNTFGLRFDHLTQAWLVIAAANLASPSVPFSLQYKGDTSLTNKDSSWLIRFDFSVDHWEIKVRGLRYVFESERDVRFFVNQFYKISGAITGQAALDEIAVLGTNHQQSTQLLGLGEDIKFRIYQTYNYADGYTEPRRIQVTFTDDDSDGVPDDPELFEKLVLTTGTFIGSPPTLAIRPAPLPEQYIFHKKLVDQYGFEYYELTDVITIDNQTVNIVSAPQVSPTVVLTYIDQDARTRTVEPLIYNGTVVFDISTEQFYQFIGGDKTISANYTLLVDQTVLTYHIGRKNLHFLWKHFASNDQRIDPAITNIIDNFVLTVQYNIDYRNWVASTDLTLAEPVPPTTEQLKIDFAELDNYKMVSDEVVWRPVKYKPLFGEKAAEEVRAKIKIVKVSGTSVSDSEIKSRVISAVNNYFSIDFWDFGDTFFASELAAYVHQQLPTIVGGFELVPLNGEAKFGFLQQIKAEANEIFISVAKVSDVEVVPVFTSTALRVGK
jgi:hypothetical protein